MAPQLSTPQPAPAKVTIPLATRHDWTSGAARVLRTRGGGFALLHITGPVIPGPNRLPLCERLDWRGRAVPPGQAALNTAKVARLLTPMRGHTKHPAQTVTLGSSDPARLIRLGIPRGTAWPRPLAAPHSSQQRRAHLFGPNVPKPPAIDADLAQTPLNSA